MNKLKIFSIATAFFVASFFAITSLVGAHSFKTGDNVTVGGSETIDNTLFASGRNIDISGTINGDVFCAGQTVTISAKVNGDILCAGQTVRVSGEVSGDIRIAAQTINVNGAVEGNATVGGQTFTLESDGSVNGDVTLGATDAVINGNVGRDVAVGGSDVAIGGTVGRNIKGELKNLELLSGANIEGQIEYTSQNDIVINDGAEVAGAVIKTIPVSSDKSFTVAWSWFLYFLLASFFAVLVLVLLFPGAYRDITERAMPSPWKSLLIGFSVSFIAPIVLILLLITVIGIPLAVILGLLWLVVVLLSGSFTSFYVGRKILQDSKNVIAIMLSGTAIMTILYFIPIIGFFAVMFSSWFGTGMIISELMRRTPRPEYASIKSNAKKSKK